jgi:DNA polymerase
VFSTHGKIYEASAAQMFKVPIEAVTKGSALRQKGKISELALGYGGGKGALLTMGALKMGLKEDELQGLVDTWRKANPRIVKLWYEVEEAALEAVLNKSEVVFKKGIIFIGTVPDMFFIQLPSGRKIAYLYPEIKTDPRYNKKCLTYAGVEQETKRFERSTTYGGKLTENIVQAIARDCLAESMLRLDEAGYPIVMHVHDECVIDTSKGTLNEACAIMGQSIPWAPGLPLRADGFETNFYKKD